MKEREGMREGDREEGGRGNWERGKDLGYM